MSDAVMYILSVVSSVLHIVSIMMSLSLACVLKNAANRLKFEWNYCDIVMCVNKTGLQ